MAKLSDFDYCLPKNLIAQKPIKPRDHSRLMILSRKKQTITHDYFLNLVNYLPPESVLVANNSKVIPARLIGHKPTGGKIEILLLKNLSNNVWQVMVGGKIPPEIKITFDRNLSGVLLEKNNQFGKIKFSPMMSRQKLAGLFNKIGQTPTPPYIKRLSNLKEYQTIYAKISGSIAAPTAGFHFTESLIKKLKKQGFKFDFITLHVGLRTFQPVRVEKIKQHQMHSEQIEITLTTAKNLNASKKQNKKIIAIGTTSARALESFANKNNYLTADKKSTDIFIYPGYKFKFIDGLITNFHLPKSTLLMLVSAFAGQSFIKKAYQQAIEKKYRFYSFGDAMLII